MAKRRRAQVDDSDNEDTPTQSSADSVSSTPAPPQKKKKLSTLELFNQRYDVENTSKEDILGASMDSLFVSVRTHSLQPNRPKLGVRRAISTTACRRTLLKIQTERLSTSLFANCESHLSFVLQVESISPRHPRTKITRARHDVSTSNLKNHAESCAPSKDPKQGTLDKDVAGANYSRAKFRFILLRWIVCRHRPFAIVEDPELIEAFQMLYAQAEIPSARTISRDVQEVFELTKREVSLMLQVRTRPSLYS